MDLEQAGSELNYVNNNIAYWESRRETIRSKLYRTNFNTKERVDGGVKDDKLIQYVEEKEKINEKLAYYREKKKDLEEFINKELDRLQNYNDLSRAIVYLRDIKVVEDEKTKEHKRLTLYEVAKVMHLSYSHTVKLYREAKVKLKEE